VLVQATRVEVWWRWCSPSPLCWRFRFGFAVVVRLGVGWRFAGGVVVVLRAVSWLFRLTSQRCDGVSYCLVQGGAAGTVMYRVKAFTNIFVSGNGGGGPVASHSLLGAPL
jgi:hypothetical protein